VVEDGDALLPAGLEVLKLGAVGGEFGAEVLQAVSGLFGFGSDELAPREVGIGVDCAGK
jgi:hypothetical protein